jgi:hypothetical protein
MVDWARALTEANARADAAVTRADRAEASLCRVRALVDRAERTGWWPNWRIEAFRIALDGIDAAAKAPDLWDLLEESKPGFCCQDAFASTGRSSGTEVLHTSGCPNRCSRWVPTQRPDTPTAYPCALTTDHDGDCWLHPDYRAEGGTDA